MKELIEKLKKLSKRIKEDSDRLYDIEVRGGILEDLQKIHADIEMKEQDLDYTFQKCVIKAANYIIHELMLNNQDPDLGLKLCERIDFLILIFDD